jgi:hypothetical protein
MAKDEPGEAFRKWRNEYGSVYTYWLGELPAVAITDYETTVETLVKDGDAYAGRTDFIEFNELIRGSLCTSAQNVQKVGTPKKE